MIAHRVRHERQPMVQVVQVFGGSRRTALKWLAGYQAGGPPALADRPSAHQCRPIRPGAAWLAQVEHLRRERWTGPRIAYAFQLPRRQPPRAGARLGEAAPA